MTFSIFYNNALYLFLVLFASFYALRSFNPSAYPFTLKEINYNYLSIEIAHNLIGLLPKLRNCNCVPLALNSVFFYAKLTEIRGCNAHEAFELRQN